MRYALKKELENVYKQIDMYKKTIEDLKNNDFSEKADEKLNAVENRNIAIDAEIEKVITEIQLIKNVMANQNSGMKRDKGWDVIDELKPEAEVLRLKLRDINK